LIKYEKQQMFIHDIAWLQQTKATATERATKKKKFDEEKVERKETRAKFLAERKVREDA